MRVWTIKKTRAPPSGRSSSFQGNLRIRSAVTRHRASGFAVPGASGSQSSGLRVPQSARTWNWARVSTCLSRRQETQEGSQEGSTGDLERRTNRAVRPPGARLRRHLPSDPVPLEDGSSLPLLNNSPPTAHCFSERFTCMDPEQKEKKRNCFKCCFVLNLLLKTTNHQLYF